MLKALYRWRCKWRGYHEANYPYFVDLETRGTEEGWRTPIYVALGRKCKCGAEAKPVFSGGLHPGGMLTYEQHWPYEPNR
jgi:hypothetical protein